MANITPPKSQQRPHFESNSLLASSDLDIAYEFDTKMANITPPKSQQRPHFESNSLLASFSDLDIAYEFDTKMANIRPPKSHQLLLLPQQELPQQMVAPQDKSPKCMRAAHYMLATSDDNVMMKEILATHAHDGRKVDVSPLLQLIKEILPHSTSTAVDGARWHHGSRAYHMYIVNEMTQHDAFEGMREALAYTMHNISCEISCKCSGRGNEHSATVALFNTLSSYSWDAKVVLVLAAFAITYGEYWLVAELYSTNPLAKSIAMLKRFPDLLEPSESLRPRFEALTALIKDMVDVTNCVVEFNELSTEDISPDQPPMSVASAQIPIAVYWTVRSVVACASQIIGLTGLGHEYVRSTTDPWELSNLARKVNNIHEHLQAQLTLCRQAIYERKLAEAYLMLVRLFKMIHNDNMKILEALFYAKDDLQPLLEGTTKKRVGLEVLRRKIVLLLISDLDVSQEELSNLDQTYSVSRDMPTRTESQYEVVWLPVVDRTLPWTDEKQREFERLQSKMTWYSVTHHSLIGPAVIKYIKEVWLFNKKPILVVLDPQGRVVNPNALPMIGIWGSSAFPFTSTRERELWTKETWGLKLLVPGIDPKILSWIAEERLICLYGGEDIEWIRKFTKTARAVAEAAGIPFEMVYMGKSNPKERVRRNITAITTENLSGCWPDLTTIWLFWIRLESMLYSKMRHGKTIENDQLMQEIMTMLTFDGSEKGWALISQGSANMAKAKGDKMLSLFQQYDQWEDFIEEMGFVGAINYYLQQLHTTDHCNHLFLRGTVGGVPEMLFCTECGRPMEKLVMYRCCTD